MPNKGIRAAFIGRRPWLKLGAATVVGAVIAASAVIPAQAAPITTDTSQAEGVLVSGSGLVNPAIVQLKGAYSSTNPTASAGVVSNPLDLTALSSVGVGLGNGVNLLGSNGLLTLGVVGQYAKTTAISSTASSGLVGSDGSVSIGSGTPGGASTLNLTPLLSNVAGLSAVATQAQLDVGALGSSITAQRGTSVATSSNYGIAGADFSLTSPAIAGLSTSLQTTVNGVGTSLNSAVGSTGLVNSLNSGVVGPLTTALTPLLGNTLSLAGTSTTVSLSGLNLSGVLAPILNTTYTSGGVTITPSTGKVVIDLATLQALNGQPANTKLLSDSAVRSLVNAAIQDILVRQIPTAINTAVQTAIGNAVLTVKINTTAQLVVAGLRTNVATIGLNVTAPLSSVLAGTNTGVVTTATVGVIGSLVNLDATQVVAAVTPVITGTVLPLVAGVLTPITTGVTSTLTSVTTPVSTLVAPVLDLLNQVVSLTVNAQDTTTGFQDARGTDAGARSVHALRLSILGASGLATVDLATSTVDATTITPLTIATPTAGQQFTVATSTATRSITVTGAGEPGATVAVDLGSGHTGTATVATDGTWTTTIAGIGAANSPVTASAVQTFGTVVGAAVTRTFTVVAQQQLTITSPTEGRVYTVVSQAATTPVVVTGTATPGSAIAVSLGGSLTGTATTGSDGTWTTTVPAVPVAASYTISATQTSGGVQSAPVTRGISVVAGAPLTVTAPADNTTLVVPGATSTTTVTSTGTAQPGATVTVTLTTGTAAPITVTTTALADGSWSVGAPGVGVGTYGVAVTQTVAGTASDPITRTVTVAAATPIVIQSPIAGAQFVVADSSSTTPVTVSGTAQAGAPITVVLKTGISAATTADLTGKWSVAFATVPVGSYTAGVTQTVAGAVSAAVTQSFAVVPGTALTIAAPVAGSTVTVADPSNTVPIVASGQAQPNASVTVTLGSSTSSPVTRTVTASDTGAWTTTFVGVAVDSHTITATQTVNGTTSLPVTSAFSVSAGAAVAITSPASDATVLVAGAGQAATVTVTGSAQPGADVEVSIGGTTVPATLAPDGTWTATVTNVAIGTPTISVTQTVGGTTSPAVTQTITVAAGAAITIDRPTPNSSVTVLGQGGSTDVVVAGHAQPLSTVVVALGTQPARTTTTTVSGTWTVTVPGVPVGSYPLTATQTVNGTSSTTAQQTFTVAAGEGIVVTSPASGTSYLVADGAQTKDVVVSGAATPGADVQVVLSPLVFRDVVADPVTGTWSVTFAALPVAGYTVTATQTVDQFTTTAPLVTFRVDAAEAVSITSPPAAGLTVIVATDTSSTTVPITGVAAPGATVSVTVGGSAPLTTTAQADGSWTVVSPSEIASPTPYAVSVTQSIDGTTSAPVTAAFTVTAGAPFTVTTPLPNAAFPVADASSRKDVTVGGTGEKGAIVTVVLGSTTQTTTVLPTGQWSVLFAQVAAGTYPVSSHETLGSTSSATDTRTVSIVPGTPVSVTTPPSGSAIPLADASVQTPVTLTGRGAVGATVSVTVGSGSALPATVDGSGVWTVTTPALPSGGYVASITQTLGGTTSVPVISSFSLTPAPAVTVTSPVDGTRVIVADADQTATVTVSGTAAPNSTVHVTLGTARTVDQPVAADGTWSATIAGIPASVPAVPLTLSVTQTVPGTPLVSVATTSEALTSSITVTTGAPLVVVAPADGSTVTVASDTSTTDVTLAGTAQPGATVSLTVNDGTPVVVTADATGNWSTILAKEPVGPYTVVATQALAGTPIAGGTTSGSVTSTFTVSAGRPLVVTSPSATPSTVVIPTADLTTTIPVSGTAQPSALVTVQLENGIAASATADADGAWTANLRRVPTGPHTLTFQQTVGTTSSPAQTRTVTVVNASALTIATPAPGAVVPLSSATASAGITVTGSAQPNVPVSVSLGGSLTAETTSTATGSWTATVLAVPVGTYTISATQTIGTAVSPAVTQPIIVVQAAAVVIATPAAGTSFPVAVDGSTATVTVTGTAQPGAVVSVGLDAGAGVPVTADGTGAWSHTFPAVPTGSHTITASEATADGSTTPVTRTFSVDVAADLTISTPQPAQQFQVAPGGSTDVVVSGTGLADALVHVTLDTQRPTDVTVSAAGSWTTTFTGVAIGSHIAEATQTVGGTDQSPQDVAFSVVPTAVPSAPVVITTPTEGLIIPDLDGTGRVDVPVSGTGQAGSSVTVDLGDGFVTTLPVASDGTWATTFAAVPVGTYTIVVTQKAGSVVTSSDSATVVLTSVTPVVVTPIASLPVSDPTGVADVTVSGSGQPGATVTVTLGTSSGPVSGLTATGPVAADGTFSLVVPNVPVGTYTASVTEQVAGGTTAPVTTPVAVRVAAALVVTPPADQVAGPDGTASLPVSGTGQPGTTVSVQLDDGTAVDVVVDAAGTWHTTFLRVLVGRHVITVTQTLADGAIVTLTEDVTVSAPIQAVITSPVAGQQFQVVAGGATNITVTGTGQPGASLALVLDSGAPATVPVADDGTWTATFGPVAIGGHTVTATETVGGAAQTPTSVAFSVVPVAVPVAAVTLSSPTAGQVIVDADGDGTVSVPVSGTGQPGSTITVDLGSGISRTVTVPASGTWSVTVDDVPVGPITVTATQTTNETVTGSVTVVLSAASIAPVVITAPTAGLQIPQVDGTSGASFTATGTAEPSATVSVSLDSGTPVTVTASALGAWTLPLTGLTTAQHTLTATETVGGATSAPTSVAFSVIAAPTRMPIWIASPPQQHLFFDRNADGTENITATGYATPLTQVTIALDEAARPGLVQPRAVPGDPGTVTVPSDATGFWTTQFLQIPYGTHAFTASQTVAGVTDTTPSQVFMVAGVTPVTVSSPVAGASVAASSNGTASIPVTGTGEPGATIVVTLAGQSQTVTVDAQGNWTTTFAGVPVGQHSAVVTETVGGFTGDPETTAFTVRPADAVTVPTGGGTGLPGDPGTGLPGTGTGTGAGTGTGTGAATGSGTTSPASTGTTGKASSAPTSVTERVLAFTGSTALPLAVGGIGILVLGLGMLGASRGLSRIRTRKR